MVSLAERRRAVKYLNNEYNISERHACQAMQMNRSSYRYVARKEKQMPISRERVRLTRRRELFRQMFSLNKDKHER